MNMEQTLKLAKELRSRIKKNEQQIRDYTLTTGILYDLDEFISEISELIEEV